MQFILEDKEIYCDVAYTKGTKLSMEISPEGLVSLRVPKKTTQEEIQKFLYSNRKQILRVYHRLDNQVYISHKKEYVESENFLYLGKVYTIAQLLNIAIESEEQIQAELKRFYTKETKKIIKERVSYFESLMNVRSKSITIVDNPKAWGTCNNNRELTFNYRLSMAPLPVIDSVVIHELCHIFHLNHDRSFWRKVGSYDANYKAHQDYLDRLGFFMTI